MHSFLARPSARPPVPISISTPNPSLSLDTCTPPFGHLSSPLLDQSSILH
jgi:hypothetical protein